MALPKLIPALADLTQDIAGPLPVELFREWVAGNQDADKAASLLRPFEIRGTVVASDTSGLSHLTEAADLLDVLALVSHPKEILHAIGSRIGGRAIGTWVADNSEMYYPDETPIATLVCAMVQAQARIAAEARLQIGVCVHAGAFYEIAGGLYGADADTVEYVAERFAAAGEILVTGGVVSRLTSASALTFERRRELDVIHQPGVFSVLEAPDLTPLDGGSPAYPHPYPPEFFQSLLTLRESSAPAAIRDEIYRSLLRNRAVMFIARDRGRTDAAGVTDLLDNLVTNAVMEAVVSQSAAARGHVASLGGGLAILMFDGAQEAVEAARALRTAFVESDLPVKIGIDAGPVLVFANHRGPSGIAGDAVNVASKLSEDLGEPGAITVTSRAAAQVRGLGTAAPFSATISKIALTGVRI